MFFAYDYSKKRFFNLSEEFGVYPEDKITIKNDTLIMSGLNEDEEPLEVAVTQDEIYRFLDQKGTVDF